MSEAADSSHASVGSAPGGLGNDRRLVDAACGGLRATVCAGRTLGGVRQEAPPDDEPSLCARVASGESAAFEELYDRHVVRIHAHCARQLGTVQDADDLVAMVFLEAWRRRDAIRVVDGSALPWLLATATNVALNHRRSRRRYRAALARLPQPAVEPDHAGAVIEQASLEAAARSLAAALAGLADTDRQVVSLCLMEELSYEQAAEALGLTHAAVRSRLMRARKQLRTALLEAGYNPAGEGEGDE